jgi:hypothetical protein
MKKIIYYDENIAINETIDEDKRDLKCHKDIIIYFLAYHSFSNI